MTFLIPNQPPPILLSVDFRNPPIDVGLPPGGWIAGGGLYFPVNAPDTGAGLPMGGMSFRDVVVQMQLSIVEGDGNDLFGVFVRRTASGRYFCFAITANGRVVIRYVDGRRSQDVIDARIAPDVRFYNGLGAPNVFGAVASGAALTFLLNGTVVHSVIAERGLAEGELGSYLHHGPTSGRAVVRADWAQVSAVLPPVRFIRDPGL
jgi:hypothetical protein